LKHLAVVEHKLDWFTPVRSHGSLALGAFLTGIQGSSRDSFSIAGTSDIRTHTELGQSVKHASAEILRSPDSSRNRN
jgi:hypothetical protein